MVGILPKIAIVGGLALAALYAIRRFDLLGQFGSAGQATLDFGSQLAGGLGESGQGIVDFGSMIANGLGESGQGAADFLENIRDTILPPTGSSGSGSSYLDTFLRNLGLGDDENNNDMVQTRMPTLQDQRPPVLFPEVHEAFDNFDRSFNDGVGSLFNYLTGNAQEPSAQNPEITSGELQNYPMPQTRVVSGELQNYPMPQQDFYADFVGENDEYSGFFGQ